MFAPSLGSIGLIVVLLQAALPADLQQAQPRADSNARRDAQSDARPGEIPLGEWSGDGVFTYQEWPAGEAPDLPFESDSPVDLLDELSDEEPRDAARGHAHRRYRTELALWDERVENRDFVMMEIHSRRGRLSNLGDATHLVVALERVRRLSRDTVLYRVAAFSFNPGPDDELMLDPSAPPLSASCTTLEGATYLQIRYMDNFVDTLRFDDDKVEKSGMYHTKTGLIHWTEELTSREGR